MLYYLCSHSVVNGFIDQGEFKAMKTPMVVELRVVIRISFVLNDDGEYFNCLRGIVIEHSNRNKSEKNGTFDTAHFCV